MEGNVIRPGAQKLLFFFQNTDSNSEHTDVDSLLHFLPGYSPPTTVHAAPLLGVADALFSS